jgi:hypothetical protein
VGGDGRHQQQVAVGRGAGDVGSAEVAAGAGLVLHHERLPEELGELRAHDAGDLIGRAAGRERHHDAHGLRRIAVLRACARRERHAKQADKNPQRSGCRHGQILPRQF